MAALVAKDIQVLLDQPKGQGMLVSCYADTSVSDGFSSHWLQPFKTEASRIRQQFADDHQARLEFERNVDVIRLALESPEARQARGMAVFSAADRGFFLALPALEPYENRLVVDEEPYMVPLARGRFSSTGIPRGTVPIHIAPAGTRRAPADRGSLGDIDESVPKKQHSSGERWGKQQATIERHRKDHILHFQKELAQRVEEAWSQYPYQGIVLLGEHEILEQFRSYLPARLASKVVHEAAQAWTDGHGEIDEKVRAVLKTTQADAESRVLSELDRRLHEATAVAAGPQEVIDALRNGQVAALIWARIPRRRCHVAPAAVPVSSLPTASVPTVMHRATRETCGKKSWPSRSTMVSGCTECSPPGHSAVMKVSQPCWPGTSPNGRRSAN